MRKYKQAVLILLVLGFIVSSLEVAYVSAESETVTVKLTIWHIYSERKDDEGCILFRERPGKDFLVKVWIDDDAAGEEEWKDDPEDADIYPDWVFIHDVTRVQVPIRIEVRDREPEYAKCGGETFERLDMSWTKDPYDYDVYMLFNVNTGKWKTKDMDIWSKDPALSDSSGADGTVWFILERITPTVETTDDTGKREDLFDPDGRWGPDTVCIIGGGYFPSETYDLYVVNDTTWFEGKIIPERMWGTETSVTTDERGNIGIGTVAWNPHLIAGEYDIVVDVAGNGIYDEGIDALDDDDILITAGFRVIPEVPFGTILSTLTMIGALACFVLFRKRVW